MPRHTDMSMLRHELNSPECTIRERHDISLMLSATTPSEELRKAQRRQHQRRHQRRKEGRGIPRLRSARSRPQPGQWVYCDTPSGAFYGIVDAFTAVGPTDSVMVVPQSTQGVFEAGVGCATPLHYVTHVANKPSKRWTPGDAARTTELANLLNALVAELSTYDLDPVPPVLLMARRALKLSVATDPKTPIADNPVMSPIGDTPAGQVSADECPVPGQVSGLENIQARLDALSGVPVP